MFMANKPKSCLPSLLILFLIFTIVRSRPIHIHHEETPLSPRLGAVNHHGDHDQIMTINANIKDSGPSPGEGHSYITGSHN